MYPIESEGGLEDQPMWEILMVWASFNLYFADLLRKRAVRRVKACFS